MVMPLILPNVTKVCRITFKMFLCISTASSTFVSLIKTSCLVKANWHKCSIGDLSPIERVLFCLYQFYETPFESSSFLSMGYVLTSICQRSYLAENLYFDSITVSSFMGGGETFCPVFETILNSSTALI